MSDTTTPSSKMLDKLKAGALIALVYFLYSIFDSRYALKADFSQTQITLAVIETEVKNINKKLDDTNQALKEALDELRNNRNKGN